MAERAGGEGRRAYGKSAITRAAILTGALAEFGEHGFAAATTRRIADKAGVALPAIAYHFGSKEGLYRACAEAIVARYQAGAGEAVARAAALMNAQECDPDQYRALLADALTTVLRLFMDETEGQVQADFAIRELRDRGPAFEILHEQLWQPGVEMIARLVAGVRGSPAAAAPDRVQALMLISSLLAFAMARDVWPRILNLTDRPDAIGLVEQGIRASMSRL